jgi:class 3 adenylate cyclase/HAMP domain-containing protein
MDFRPGREATCRRPWQAVAIGLASRRVSLRRKITIAFFLVSALVSVILAGFLHRFIERHLVVELRDKLHDIAHLGAHTIDTAAYRRLIDQLGELDDDTVSTVEHSPDWKAIYEQLRQIRATEPMLIHYAYVLAPGDDPRTPRFVVDANVLELAARIARGETVTEDVSHFNKPFDVSGIPLLQRALTACTSQLEPDFVADPTFGVRSISAYVPLVDATGAVLRDDRGRCLGVLGIDMTDTNMRAALDAAGNLALQVSIAVVVLALIVSIIMGTVLTRSVVALSSTVHRFAAKDFSARTRVFTKDEIGQLGHSFNAMADTIQVHSEQLEELVRLRTRELTEEKQTSERLLLNVLPGPIAERLKTGENLIVDRFDAVSVLFADIVGFTSLSLRTSPEALVTMLNELFSTFDRLAEHHGLEKIKTIGDAYMVVAGIPNQIADHAIAITQMAIDMIASVEAYGRRAGMELTIRVGIHTGSVVAGVIGTKKFIYDLWGDTVNTASRMESHGVPGRVHVTEATYRLLVDGFELEKLAPIDVKGKGTMQTYLVIRRKEARRTG